MNRANLKPWDVGEGGYQVGNFPPLWSEWNGKYRDCAREFWRGEDSALSEFAHRITGSSDLYEGTGRRPFARALISSPLMTDFRFRILSPITRSTMRPMVKRTGTGTAIIGHGTAGLRSRQAIQKFWIFGLGRSGTSWSLCFFLRECRCSWGVMK